jgi:hypothetical protein
MMTFSFGIDDELDYTQQTDEQTDDSLHDNIEYPQFEPVPNCTPQLSYTSIMEACKEMVSQAGNDQGLLREVMAMINDKTREMKARTLKRKLSAQGTVMSSHPANEKARKPHGTAYCHHG